MQHNPPRFVGRANDRPSESDPKASNATTPRSSPSHQFLPLDDVAAVSVAVRGRPMEDHVGANNAGARRVGYSVREASELLGRRADALRREIERHARVEGTQRVARLAGGISAYRRKDGGRWLISIPAHLGA